MTIFVVAAFVSIVTFITCISNIIAVNFIIFDNSSINYIKEINISSLKANSLSITILNLFLAVNHLAFSF